MAKILFCLLTFVGAVLFRTAPVEGAEAANGPIVSLAPSLTEFAYALGLGGQIAGTTDQCDFPVEARKTAKVGSFAGPSVEKVLALRPRTVLAAEGTPADTLVRLRGLGMRVVEGNVKSVDELPGLARRLGRELGKPKEGEKLALEFESGLARLRTNSHKARGSFLLALQFEPLISATNSTWLGDLLSRIGLKNVMAENPVAYPKVSREFVLKAKPDVIFADAHAAGSVPAAEADKAAQSAVFAIFGKGHLPRVVVLPPDILVRPGPRIVEGIDFLLKLHL